MRRIILTIILTAGTLGAFAQPRAAGLRLGITGFEADYQHTIQKNQFAEGGIGLDFGYNANGTPGIKATGTYNFIWARPAWTNKGTWAQRQRLHARTMRASRPGIYILVPTSAVYRP